VTLSEEDVTALNQALEDAGFAGELEVPDSPFVVGYVKSAERHPDSDHMFITQTVVDHDQTLQIVCGSPNMREGIRVVVAKPGAMMADGKIIWPGVLRGVDSAGMICTGRELGLANAPTKPGCLILDDDFEVGSAFDFDRGNTIFKA